MNTTYDDLGRKTALKKGSSLLAKWTYDTVAKGQPASSIRYIDGKEYASAVNSYNDAYQPTSSTVTIPADAGALAGTYTWTYGYNAYTGLQEWIKHPAVGNLPSERETTVYGEGNLPQKTTAGSITLVNATNHDVFSRPVRTEYGTLGKKVYKTQVYDEFTGRLTRQTTDRDLAPQRIDDVAYAYDDAGNITGITTTSGQDAAKTVDSQCFINDALDRLTEAWTAKTDCTTQPSASTVGGPDAYWQSFAYDPVGNRIKETDHGTGALAGSDATTTYVHSEPKTGLPHAAQTATVAGGPDDGQKSSFDYDAAGNTTKRTIGATTQALTWDDEGHLATLTEGGKTASYKYDPDGNRLVAKDADGTQTLTLPGDNELKIKADGTKEGVRYYSHEGQTVAVRTSKGFSFLFSDQQGTAMTAVAMTTLTVTRRKQLPFGQQRSAQTETIPGTRGFVGGTSDPTGLVHLGAREYDPTLGRFISVDPVINLDSPSQMNAYSYAHNNPVTMSDPTGECNNSDCPSRNCLYCLNYTPGDKGQIKKSIHDRPGSGSTPNNTKQYAKRYAMENAAAVYASSLPYDSRAAAARVKSEMDAAAQAERRRKKEGIKGKILGFIHEHRNAIELIGDAGQAVNFTATGLAAACIAVSMGACVAGPAETLATVGKIGAGVAAASAGLQAVDSCTNGSNADCVHDGWGAATAVMEIAIPYLPTGGARLYTRAQEAYTSGDTRSLIGRVTRWMFPRD
ncbi:RHS repeat domain-containing protein [Streptomyces sp. PG2]